LFRKDLLKAHLKERFHVTPKDGSPPFDGVMVGCTKWCYEFVDVRVNGQRASSPLFIDRDNVSYVQAVVVTTDPAVVVSNVVG